MIWPGSPSLFPYQTKLYKNKNPAEIKFFNGVFREVSRIIRCSFCHVDMGFNAPPQAIKMLIRIA
jgi:hypothetical protein